MNTPTQSQLSEMIQSAHRHKASDALIRGSYGDAEDASFKGCSVGCDAYDIDKSSIARGDQHKVVAEHYGIPEWLVYLRDTLFENADVDIHTKLAEAIAPRSNWKSVMHVIHWRILNEITLPVAGDSAAVVQVVIDLHKSESEDSAAWSAARSAAGSAAWSAAARSAAESAVAVAAAAWSAARSAAGSAARSAAWSAAAWSATRSAAWSKIMNIVLEEVARAES